MVLYYPGSFFVAVTLSKRHLTRYVRRAGQADPLRPQKLNSNTGENTKSH